MLPENGRKKYALEAFLYSLTMDVPRAEICCEVGKIFLERELPRQAGYWYGQALTVPSDKKKCGFFMAECHGFVPYMQLCVCYDKMGCPEQAFFFHKKAKGLKPEDPGVLYDQKYFWENMVWYKRKDIFIIFFLAGYKLAGILCTGKSCCHIL